MTWAKGMGRRALLLCVAMATLGAAARVGAAEGMTLWGYAQQTASAETPLSGGASFTGGAATSIALVLDAIRDSASLRASVHFSILYGDEASNLWLSLIANPIGAASLLMTPAFDPAAAIPDTIALLALDDAALRWDIGAFAFEAGKTYANWGVGKAFSPADFFAEFDYSSGTPSRRSKLIAKATWFTGTTSRIDLVFDPYATSGGAIAARAYATAFDSLAFSLAAGLREAAGGQPRKLLGSLEASFDLPFVSPYGEAAFAMTLDGSSALSYSLLGGAMARAGDVTMAGEYLFSPNATIKHGVFGLASLPMDEWTAFSVPMLYYPESGVLTTGINLTVNGLAGLDLGLGAAVSRSAVPVWKGKLTLSARSTF